jgi:hypothetical protein
MPYDRRHVLAQWGGTLSGGEIWSNSLRLVSSETGNDAAVPVHDEMVAWLEGPAKDAAAAFHNDFNTGLSSKAKLEYLKLNVVDINGHYVEQNTLEYLYNPPVLGGSGAAIHPTQVSLVVSTTTEFSRGYAHRGRFYLPMPAQVLDAATGLVPAPTAMNVAIAAKTFIVALADQSGPDAFLDMRVAVMSKRGTGATNVVTGVAVGCVMDTQRRRRNSLPENYQEVQLTQ